MLFLGHRIGTFAAEFFEQGINESTVNVLAVEIQGKVQWEPEGEGLFLSKDDLGWGFCLSHLHLQVINQRLGFGIWKC